MTEPDAPMLYPRPQAITFDFYGTLVQWHEGLQGVVEELLTRKSASHVTPGQLLHGFHQIGRQLRDERPHRAYRDVLRDSLRAALTRCDCTFVEDDFQLLVSRIYDLPAFPEVRDVLARLKVDFRIGVISNTDDDLIAGSIPNIGVALDHVVTAQQAVAYKPDARLFKHAHQVIGVGGRDVVHVGASLDLDMRVCQTLGIRAIWINRRHETPDPTLHWSHLEQSDLRGLPALLGC